MTEAILTNTPTMTETEKACILGLLKVPDFGSATIRKLVASAGSAEMAWRGSEAFLRAHLTSAKVGALLAKRSMVEPEALLEAHYRENIRLIPQSDPEYPPMLREIHNPPVMLFVKGNVNALTGRTLAVVGTRYATDYGRTITAHLVQGLHEAGLRDAVIISGLAAGIDSCAHWAALEHGFLTTAVFGCGLDVIFPTGNKRLAAEILDRNGALVSEYPLGIGTSSFTFPQRNRIVAGLSYGVVVVEGGAKSGALITARLAAEEGRSVFAVPGNVLSPMSQGPVALLRSGAIAVASAADILEDLRWVVSPERQQQQRLLLIDNAAELSETEQKLLALIAYDPVALDSVFIQAAERLKLPSAEVNTLLTTLELEGCVKLLPGACVCRL